MVSGIDKMSINEARDCYIFRNTSKIFRRSHEPMMDNHIATPAISMNKRIQTNTIFQHTSQSFHNNYYKSNLSSSITSKFHNNNRQQEMIVPSFHKRVKNISFSSNLFTGVCVNQPIVQQPRFKIVLNQKNRHSRNQNIFALIAKQKDKEEQEKAHFTGKSFKIRSFTKKVREGLLQVKKQKESDPIFHNISNMRNFKSTANREQSTPKECLSDNLKMLRKVKELIKKEKENDEFDKLVKVEDSKQEEEDEEGSRMDFQKLDCSTFQSIANKIIISYNEEYCSNCQEDNLLVISSSIFSSQPKRYWKNEVQEYRSMKSITKTIPKNDNKNTERSIEEHLQLIFNTDHPTSSIFQNSKIALKVQNYHELLDLKSHLQNLKITNYFCIFFANKKYSQRINLYDLRTLTNRLKTVVVVQNRSQLDHEFPLIGEKQNVVFVAPKNMDVGCVSQFVKKVKSIQLQSDLMEQQKQIILKSEQEDPQSSLTQLEKYYKPANLTYPNSSLQKQEISLPYIQMVMKARYINQSRNIKKKIRRNQRSKSNQRSRTLCEISQSQIGNRQNKGEVVKEKQKNVEKYVAFKEKIIKYVKILEEQKKSHSKKKIEKRQLSKNSQKELEQLTETLINPKAKTGYQIISDLMKNNSHIIKQITKYIDYHEPLITQKHQKRQPLRKYSVQSSKEYFKNQIQKQNDYITISKTSSRQLSLTSSQRNHEDMMMTVWLL